MSEENYIGTKFSKPLSQSDLEFYHKIADWCNSAHKATIKDFATYYEVVENTGPTTEYLAKMFRYARDKKLKDTDYLIMADYPISEAKRAEVESYRQALRDMTHIAGFPWDGGGADTPWPAKPEI